MSIKTDDLESEIIGEKKPVLMARLNRSHECEDQKEILRSVSREYGETLKVFLSEEDSIGVFRRFGIDGSPAFIIFHKGEAKGRILGKADRSTLRSFISRILSRF